MWLLRSLWMTVVFDLMSSFVFADPGEPKIKPFQFSVDLELGMREAVHCIVTFGDPPFEFSWCKDGQLLVNTRGVSHRKTDDFTSNLVISKVDADSNGNYTCKVTNAAGFDEKSAVLSVRVAIISMFCLAVDFVSGDSGEPKIKSFHFSNDLDSGMRESVQCAVVYGDPPFDFKWFKDGKPLMDERDISIHKTNEFTSNLAITKVNANSNGNYTCKVSNSKGFDEKWAVLSVKGSNFSSVDMLFKF
ncbi:Down syndrome cell adhesion molecule like protein [Argiope bruennichi]|uniref:Down syndrome cell adhesion molecule like protein n=1 Tax=Argiope bruennichi TaxID=94029 RepID=A0A8T0E3T8_ARGBR|nr:Down syndrome cell adhesion molecule like protein [Argiope bruennichi]